MLFKTIKTLPALSLFLIGASPSLAAGPEVWESACLYHDGSNVVASTLCTVSVYANINTSSSSEEWQWDNGNFTKVETNNTGLTVNGKPAEIFEEYWQHIDVEATACYRFIGTDEFYCWGV